MNWEKMPLSHKIATVISGLAVVVWLISKVKPDLFPFNPTYPAIAVFTLCEAVVYWKKRTRLKRLSSSSSSREWYNIFKVMKGKNLQPRILYPARISFRFDGEINSLTEKQKLRIQYCQTGFATNAKGTSLGRKGHN